MTQKQTQTECTPTPQKECSRVLIQSEFSLKVSSMGLSNYRILMVGLKYENTKKLHSVTKIVLQELQLGEPALIKGMTPKDTAKEI